MKKYIYLSIILMGVFLSACSPKMLSTKDVRYMSLHFEPLSKKDFTLVGNLEASYTVTGKIRGGKKTLDAEFAATYKKGLVSTRETTEFMYFSPGENEVITGSLYENEIFNSIYIPGGGTSTKLGFFARMKSKNAAALSQDPAVDFAYYSLIEKYADLDYFINVRFDRKLTVTGKKFTETVTVKADGIRLRTDN